MIIGPYPLEVPGSAAAFSPGFYAHAYPDVATSGLTPAEHFERVGKPHGRYRSNAELAAHEFLLRRIPQFDEQHYRRVARLPGGQNAAVHYLLNWRNAPEPSATFEGRFLAPYYAEVGLHAPPPIVYAVLKDAGWPVYPSRASAMQIVHSILSTGAFDARFYARKRGDHGIEPAEQALHYVLIGERLGLSPSPEFDVAVYARQSPDLVTRGGANLFHHYLTAGRAEGRLARPPAKERLLGRTSLDAARPTVLLVSHEASRTGAPILAFNIAERLAETHNVVALLLGPGELEQDFDDVCATVIGPLEAGEKETGALASLLGRAVELYRPAFALVNSIESRAVIGPLNALKVPTVTLVHEFSSLIPKAEALLRAMDSSTELVFPARSVLRSAEQAHPWLSGRRLRVQPQGQSRLPAGPQSAGVRDVETRRLPEALERQGDAFLVLGLGTVMYRKGVDLFIATAAALKRRQLDRPVRFLWIGKGYRPRTDVAYSAYLAEQMAHSGVGELVEFLDPVADLEPAYRRGDALLLSSRLDPMPNVAIDAALAGMPVISFQGSGGVPEIFEASEETADSVVAHADAEGAADALAALINNPEHAAKLSAATADVARQAFRMAPYVQSLRQLADEAAAAMARRSADAEVILASGAFDADFFLRRSTAEATLEGAVDQFVLDWEATRCSPLGDLNPDLRRPRPDFDPLLYARSHDLCGPESPNPFAHWLRAGRPEGPWLKDVLRPEGPAPGRSNLKLALHCHLTDPSLAGGLFRRLRSNSSACELFLSTDTPDNRSAIAAVCKQYARDRVVLRLVKGADQRLAPLLAFPEMAAGAYDLIGHIHVKAPAHPNDVPLARSWREFLWQHLLGDYHPMIDRIAQHFDARTDIGLLFPAEPKLVTPHERAKEYEALDRAVGLSSSAAQHLEGPRGGMFWARADAILPLFQARNTLLALRSSSEESSTYEDWLSTAIAMLTENAGYRAGLVHVPGVRRSPMGG